MATDDVGDEGDRARERIVAVLGPEIRFELSRREDRWLALGDEIVAFAAVETSWRRLHAEAQLLERWRSAGVPAPRVLEVDPIRHVQVRERLHGITGDVVEPLIFGGARPDPVARLTDVPLSRFGERLAASYGQLVRRIHDAIAIADAATLGIGARPRQILDAAFDQLRTVGIAPALVDAAERARDWIDAVPDASAVIHGDLHFHNMCLAPDGEIVGVFDLGDAGADAAATDFQYVHSLGPRFAAIAMARYGTIFERDVRRAHVRTALGHLVDHPPGAPRHESVVAWVTAVLSRLL